MSPSSWFDDFPIIGKSTPVFAAAKLREVGEEDAAAALEKASSLEVSQVFGLRDWFGGNDRGWQHTSHAFGYLPTSVQGAEVVAIEHAGSISADDSLRSQRINIRLDGLRVADYPGHGSRRVLFDFYAQNQVSGSVEHVHFNSTYRVAEGERVAVLGYPIFLGLNVGIEGVAFKCFTVNVQNDQDEAMLGMMETDVFRAGLQLATTLQPAIGPLSGLAVALTKSIAGRHRNVPVQDFYLGLDFSNRTTGARLRAGSYIAVQIPETFRRVWDWSDWVYHSPSGQIVRKDDCQILIPYNFVIIGVTPAARV